MMPLRAGKSKATIQHNIQEMIKAGHPADQAAAASYRKARETREHRHTNNVVHGVIHLRKESKKRD